jgi:VIT1/CCC1 family predicted Fe2+/Mn2+ transporter
MIGWLLGTGIAVGLAELYSEIIGEETSTRQRVTGPRLRHMAADALAVVFGIAFPAVFFVFPLVGIGTEEGAFFLARWTGLALVAFYGFWAARFAGASWLRAVLYAVLVACVDAALIALKALVH